MAGLLAVFAAFEREILGERTRAGLAHAPQNGQRLGRPATAAAHAVEIRRLHRAGVAKAEIARRLRVGRCESSKLNPPSLRSGSRSDVYRQFITKEIISSRLVSYFKLFGRGPGWAAVGRSILEATESTKVVRQDYAAADQL
jgi:hypothetical protein